MLHADIAHAMEVRGFTLKGITVLYQRNKRVFPYGFPLRLCPKPPPPIHRHTPEMIPDNTVYLGEATEFLRKLPNSYADLIIADPPYSLEKDREFGVGAFFHSRDEWLEWCKCWIV